MNLGHRKTFKKHFLRTEPQIIHKCVWCQGNQAGCSWCMQEREELSPVLTMTSINNQLAHTCTLWHKIFSASYNKLSISAKHYTMKMITCPMKMGVTYWDHLLLAR